MQRPQIKKEMSNAGSAACAHTHRHFNFQSPAFLKGSFEAAKYVVVKETRR